MPEEIKFCFISGPYFLRKKTLYQIECAVNKKEKIEKIIIDSNNKTRDLQESLVNNSIFEDSFKFIIIKSWPEDSEKSDIYKTIINYYNNVKDDKSLVIFDNVSIDNKKMLEIIKGDSKFINYEQNINFWECAKTIKEILSSMDKEIDIKNAEEIVKSIKINSFTYKYDYDDVYTKCLYICSYNNKKSITLDNIKKAFFNDFNYLIWNLYECLDKKDYSSSIRIFRNLINIDNDPNTNVLNMINSFMWRYNLIFIIKMFLSESQNISKTKEIILSKNKLTKTNSFYNQTFSNDKDGKKYYSLKVLEKIIEPKSGKPPVICYSEKEIIEIKEFLDKLHVMTKSEIGCNFICFLMESIIAFICNNKANIVNVYLKEIFNNLDSIY